MNELLGSSVINCLDLVKKKQELEDTKNKLDQIKNFILEDGNLPTSKNEEFIGSLNNAQKYITKLEDRINSVLSDTMVNNPIF